MIVNFPAYRDFNEARINANDCMMAILVSSDISIEHLGQLSPEGKRLPEIIGHLNHVSRVNLTPPGAITLIHDSESIFVDMAVSQTLAVHEYFLRAVAKILLDNHFSHRKVNLSNVEWVSLVHILNFIQVSCQLNAQNKNWVLYEYIRNIRNRIVHARGKIDASINYSLLSLPAQTEWERLTGRHFSDAVHNGCLSLKSSELVAVLAIANNTAKYVNEKLALAIPKNYWAQLIIDDFKASHPNEPLASIKARKIYKYCEMHYGQLQLTHAELDVAIGTG